MTILAILGGTFLVLVAIAAGATVIMAVVLSRYDDAIANGRDLPGSLGASSWPDRGDWEVHVEQAMALIGMPTGPLGEAVAVAELRRELADDEEIWAWFE